MAGMKRAAVIDMGSNSFRLVVYGYEPGRYWQHVDEIREAVRISAGMGDEQRVQPEPWERAVRTAALFSSFCSAASIDDVTTVATSAIRVARNREALLEEIERASSLEVRVISEAEEARYGYLALANSTTVEDGFGFDVGGGSVQAMRLKGRKLAQSASWPLGAVRVSETFLPGEKATGKAIKALRRHVASVTSDWFEPHAAGRAAGIGGTIRNLAAAAEKRAELPFTDAQGFTLTGEALEELIEELAALPASKRGDFPGIKPDRGDVILGGAVVLSELMCQAGVEAVEATDAGLREGIFFERLLVDRDPPLFTDVRRASVENVANRYHDDLRHQRHVAELSLQVYDGLGGLGLVDADDVDRELLWAACLLHDIGTAIDYDDHHKHSRYLILNAGLPGFDPREVELIALIARYHRKGQPDVSELGAFERPGDERKLSTLSGIIRLAEQLERSRDRAVAAVAVGSDDGTVTLRPDTRADATVAIWSARRSSDLLSRALGRTVEIDD
jgi:exopolyphosphatase/guanosine-5'-triphosphate,3'-diphosphate pyrophosphatase